MTLNTHKNTCMYFLVNSTTVPKFKRKIDGLSMLGLPSLISELCGIPSWRVSNQLATSLLGDNIQQDNAYVLNILMVWIGKWAKIYLSIWCHLFETKR